MVCHRLGRPPAKKKNYHVLDIEPSLQLPSSSLRVGKQDSADKGWLPDFCLVSGLDIERWPVIRPWVGEVGDNFKTQDDMDAPILELRFGPAPLSCKPGEANLSGFLKPPKIACNCRMEKDAKHYPRHSSCPPVPFFILNVGKPKMTSTRYVPIDFGTSSADAKIGGDLTL